MPIALECGPWLAHHQVFDCLLLTGSCISNNHGGWGPCRFEGPDSRGSLLSLIVSFFGFISVPFIGHCVPYCFNSRGTIHEITIVVIFISASLFSLRICGFHLDTWLFDEAIVIRLASESYHLHILVFLVNPVSQSVLIWIHWEPSFLCLLWICWFTQKWFSYLRLCIVPSIFFLFCFLGWEDGDEGSWYYNLGAVKV